MEKYDKLLSEDHLYMGYFREAGHHEAAALLYLGDLMFTAVQELTEAVKDLRKAIKPEEEKKEKKPKGPAKKKGTGETVICYADGSDVEYPVPQDK